MLRFSWEKREAGVKFGKDGSKGPDVDGSGVRDSKNDLWRPVESGLDVGVDPLAHETARTVVNDLDARLVLLLQQDILRLEVAVNQIVIGVELQRLKDLNSYSPDQIRAHTLEVVLL